VKPQGQGSMITKTREVLLVGVMDTPVVLSHNEQTRDEHGKACVQEGLTSRLAHYGQVKASCSNETRQTTFFLPVTHLK
jgi:hypothetical protein